MLTLDLTNAPRWHDLAPGVRVQLRPLTTALMVATRSDPAVEAVPEDASDEERAVAFAKALAQLETPLPAEADGACAQALDAEVTTALDAVENQLARGDAPGARNALTVLDDRFGGLAAPRSLELARRIMAALPENAD